MTQARNLEYPYTELDLSAFAVKALAHRNCSCFSCTIDDSSSMDGMIPFINDFCHLLFNKPLDCKLISISAINLLRFSLTFGSSLMLWRAYVRCLTIVLLVSLSMR